MDHRLSLDAYSQLSASQSAEGLAALPINDPPSIPLATHANAAFDETAGLLRAHEYERQRMGQELHDCAGHTGGVRASDIVTAPVRLGAAIRNRRLFHPIGWSPTAS